MRSTFVLPAVLALVACHSNSSDPQPQQPDGPTPVVEPDEGKPVAQAEVTLSPLEKNVTVPVGATLLYSFESHASVGYGASQQVADAAVVQYVRTDTNYERSEEPRPPGADAATAVFVFEAIAPGSTTLTVDEQFRGTTKQSTTFTITVTPK